MTGKKFISSNLLRKWNDLQLWNDWNAHWSHEESVVSEEYLSNFRAICRKLIQNQLASANVCIRWWWWFWIHPQFLICVVSYRHFEIVEAIPCLTESLRIMLWILLKSLGYFIYASSFHFKRYHSTKYNFQFQFIKQLMNSDILITFDQN